jgi:hypothetical protein
MLQEPAGASIAAQPSNADSRAQPSLVTRPSQLMKQRLVRFTKSDVDLDWKPWLYSGELSALLFYSRLFLQM